MTDFIHDTLYRLSNALLLPTLILLLTLAAWTVLMAGGLVREAFSRREVVRTRREARRLLKEGAAKTAVWQRLAACRAGLPARLMASLGPAGGDPAEAVKCLEDLEGEVAATLSKLTWVTRVAPMLGLMGTLIPLGPALTGLAAGDLAALSGNLVVAFTATVIGVLVGCISFSLATVRRNWYHRDLGDLDYLVGRLHDLPHPVH